MPSRMIVEAVRTVIRGRAARIWLALLAPLGACDRPADVPIPAGYPAAYADVARAAAREGAVVVWGTTSARNAAPVFAAFLKRHPGLRLAYREMPATELNARFLRAAAAGGAPDLLWSSAMDLQVKLVNDGFAQSYLSPEAPELLSWANWKDEAWAITAEPVGLVYNRRMIADADVPRTHPALLRFLETPRAGRRDVVATYDVPRSAVGLLYLQQDQEATNGVWRLLTAMSSRGLRVFPSAEQIMDDVVAGRSAFGYNLLASHARAAARSHPDLGLVLPADYALSVSRIAIIPRGARHPSAARLLLDHLLSRGGQTALAAGGASSVRRDLSAARADGTVYRAIRVGPGLLVDTDQLTRSYVVARWHRALEAGSGTRPPTPAAPSGTAREVGVPADRRPAGRPRPA